VRDLKLEGKALFLVEPKYFDTTKKARADAAEERKRKAAERAAGNLRPAKRTRTAKGSQTTRLITEVNERDERAPAETDQGSSHTQAVLPTGPCTTIPSTSSTAPGTSNDTLRAVFEALRCAVYAEIPKAERKRTKRNVDEIEPALDDMINAGSRKDVGCFRLPVIVYFAQRKNGTY